MRVVVWWTTAWPLPRASSQRLTGNANTPAMSSATARLPQNTGRPDRRPCAGDQQDDALSTISIVVIESVSEASASGATRRRVRPARSSGRLVSA